MMQDIDRFLPDLRTYAASCPDPTAYRFLRQAARLLCQKTRLWKEWDTITVSKPDDEVLTTIRDAEIVDIETARLGTLDLDPKTPAWLDEHSPGWAQDTTVGSGRFITQIVPDRIALYPRATGALVLRLVLKPSREATQFPDFLLDHHSDLLGIGAAGNAMLVPNKDYSNPTLGMALRGQFEDGVAGLVSAALKGQQRAPRRTKGSFF